MKIEIKEDKNGKEFGIRIQGKTITNEEINDIGEEMDKIIEERSKKEKIIKLNKEEIEKILKENVKMKVMKEYMKEQEKEIERMIMIMKIKKKDITRNIENMKLMRNHIRLGNIQIRQILTIMIMMIKRGYTFMMSLNILSSTKEYYQNGIKMVIIKNNIEEYGSIEEMETKKKNYEIMNEMQKIMNEENMYLIEEKTIKSQKFAKAEKIRMRNSRGENIIIKQEEIQEIGRKFYEIIEQQYSHRRINTMMVIDERIVNELIRRYECKEIEEFITKIE